jgi:hypothetical protein
MGNNTLPGTPRSHSSPSTPSSVFGPDSNHGRLEIAVIESTMLVSRQADKRKSSSKPTGSALAISVSKKEEGIGKRHFGW